MEFIKLVVWGSLVFILVTVTNSAKASVLTNSVTTAEGMKCQTYLRIPEGSATLPILVTLSGSGIYSAASDQELPPHVAYLFNQKKVNVLSFDKPGISWVQNKVVVNDSEYNRFTMKTLSECLEQALKWAVNNKGLKFNDQIFVNAHSEGAIIAMSLLQKKDRKNDAVLKKIKMVLLSGVPMDPFKKIVSSQIPEKDSKKFWDALKRKDDSYIRTWGGVSSRYLADAFASDSLNDILKDLASRDADLNIQVFQGLNDQNVSAGAVLDFEKWNEVQAKAKKPALNFSARYYEAGHNLNRTAINDMVVLILGYIDQK